MSAGDVCVIGGGVVGVAVALALARRGLAVELLEAEPALALAASGTNSGILHTGFDSTPGALETELILRSAARRPALLEQLAVPVLRCGARMRPRAPGERDAVDALEANAATNRVPTTREPDGALVIPGEWVTDPVAYVLALAAAAERHGARIRTGVRAHAITPDRSGLATGGADGAGLVVHGADGTVLARCAFAVNAAGLGADTLATASGDDGAVRVAPRKGEFLVFAPGPAGPPDRIDLPVPDPHTKGVLVFPTLDGHVVAGPTAHDQTDKRDWSVRPEAERLILDRVAGRVPALDGARPVFAYAGLRPAGEGGTNYVFAPSAACPGLLHVGAIRSTGLSASLGIAEHVVDLLAGMGLRAGVEQPLRPAPLRPATPVAPWWRRTADHVARGDAV